MSYRGLQKKSIDNPRGAWLIVADVEGRPDRANLARNVRFLPGFFTRRGFVPAYSVASKITSLYNWISSVAQRLIWFRGGSNVEMVLLSTGEVTALYSQAARGISVAEAGTRAFIAHYDANGAGAGQVRIVQPLLGGASPYDTAFMGPLGITPVMSNLGAGDVSAGSHRFGYIVQSRTGFTGKPGPVIAGAFSPVTYNVAGDSKIRMTITGDWPADAAYVYPIMTRVSNPYSWYFIPQTFMSVPGGAVGWPVSIDIDISDATLASANESAMDNFGFLTRDAVGNGPINPSRVFLYGNRLCYIVENKAYFSEPNDYQAITEDQHTVQVEGQRDLVTGGSVRGVAYLLGDNWTFSTQDNADIPRTWGEPRKVSGRIGASCPEGFIESPSGDYSFVVHKSGLWFFNGAYPERPVSYMQQPDWDRINWAAGVTIQGAVDPKTSTVHLIVPLDGATEPGHIMTFDYSRAGGPDGVDPMQVDYSLDDIAGTGVSAIAIVQDYATGIQSPWIAKSVAPFKVLRTHPGAPYSDDGAAIHSIWHSGLNLTGADPQRLINRFVGAHIHARGSGTMIVQAFGHDAIQSGPAENITLAAEPGIQYESKWFLEDENQTVRFEVNGVNHWFNINSFQIYWSGAGTNR